MRVCGAVLLVAAWGLAGCSVPTPLTRGQLHDVPSAGAELPFADGVYVEDGEPMSCGRPEPNVEDDTTPGGLDSRYMRLAPDGAFAIGRSEEAVVASQSPYGRGNYVVTEDGWVNARALDYGPTDDVQDVVTYALVPTGPASFYHEQMVLKERTMGPDGVWEERFTCAQQAYRYVEHPSPYTSY